MHQLKDSRITLKKQRLVANNSIGNIRPDRKTTKKTEMGRKTNVRRLQATNLYTRKPGRDYKKETSKEKLNLF